MVYNREGYAPWSLTRKAGVQSATVDGTIEVPQYIQPTLDTGFVDEKGDWKGIKSSDEQFRGFTKDEMVANGAAVLVPSGPTDPDNWIDMTGFKDIIIAIKPSRDGNYAIQSVMGSDAYSFANLNPIVAASGIEVLYAGNNGFNVGVDDSAEALVSAAWNLFYVKDRLLNQKLLQFKITNNSGGDANIETAYMRLV